MLSNGEPFDVLENEVTSIELFHETNEIPNEGVAWIIDHPLPNQGKALTRCATKNDIDRLIPYSG